MFYNLRVNHKPGSVFDNHLSRIYIAIYFKPPNLRSYMTGNQTSTLALLRVGFTQPICLHIAGELLPHLFILTIPKNGGTFLLHFP